VQLKKGGRRRPRSSVVKYNNGFGLIEVLVALLVFSIGLAGLAALNVNGVRNVHSALQASVASSIALDFEERLWLALANQNSGCADAGGVASTLQQDWNDATPPVAGWGAPLRLPGLGVDVLATSGDLVTLRVSWTEERLLAADSNREADFVYRVGVPCR
jgi:type IV pilus assembly protein PilV